MGRGLECCASEQRGQLVEFERHRAVQDRRDRHLPPVCSKYPSRPHVHLIPLHSFTILLLTPPWQTFLLHPPQNLSCPGSCNPTTSPPPQLVERLTSRRRLSSPSSLMQGNDPQRSTGKTRALRMCPVWSRLRPCRYPCRPKPHRQTHQWLMSGH